MKNRVQDLCIILLMLILIIEFLMKKALIADVIFYSLSVWVHQLLPSIFPFFVVSDILVSYHITNYIPKFIKNTFCTIFCVSENIATVFFLSIASGFPSNARIIKMMYEQGSITEEEGNRALLFTHFSNPLFILSTVAVMFLHQERYGYIILISHILGNVIIGIATRRMSTYSQYDYTQKKEKSQSFSKVFIQAIKSSIDTSLLILGTLTCFLIFSSLVVYHLHLNGYQEAIVKGILEITMGLKSLANTSVSDVYKVVISTMFLSFGGFAVHLQVISQIIDTPVKYSYFFISRIFHAIISGVICYLLFVII